MAKDSDGRADGGGASGGQPGRSAEGCRAALEEAGMAAQRVRDGVVLVQRDQHDCQERCEAARRGCGVAGLHPRSHVLPRRVLAEQSGRKQGGCQQIRRQKVDDEPETTENIYKYTCLLGVVLTRPQVV